MFLDLGSLLHLLSCNTRCSVLDEEVEGEASPALLTGEVRGGEERVPHLCPVLPGLGPPVEPVEPLRHQRLGLELRLLRAQLPHCLAPAPR